MDILKKIGEKQESSDKKRELRVPSGKPSGRFFSIKGSARISLLPAMKLQSCGNEYPTIRPIYNLLRADPKCAQRAQIWKLRKKVHRNLLQAKRH
jgi:hypothetical protein